MEKLLLILLILALTVPACAAKREPVSPFAMQLHSMEGDVADHRRAIDLCAEAGVKLIRDEIHWNRVEREKGVLAIDENILRNVDSTLAAGIEPMISLDYGNKLYDDGNAPVSKEAVEGFARYCEFMARTFKGKIRYWEVWNEPNLEQFWKPSPNPKDYSALLKAAYKACKTGNPDCVVVGMATSGIPLDFIEAVLKDGGAKSMDILSVHPYRYPTSPEKGNLSADIRKLRSLMDDRGAKGKPIWVTEIGWPTHVGETGVTPDRQAAMLVRAYLEALAAGVETVFWYWFGNDGPDAAYNEHHFGIRFADGSPKPAYKAYKSMTQNLDGTKFSRAVWVDQKARAYIFARDKAEIGVFWATDGVQNITLHTGDEDLIIKGLGDGRATLLQPVNGVVTLTLTELPCYLAKRSPITQASVMPGNQFQFLPPQMFVTAGEPNDVGFRVANPGDRPIEGRVLIHSDAVVPAELEFKLEPRSKSLLIAKINTPESAPGNILSIPAEVIVGGRLTGSLELLVTLVPPDEPAP